MKNGQIEIMGLVVIVIIVAIGFFVTMVFFINKPVDDIVDDFSKDVLAQNFVSSLVETETDCDVPFDTVIQDCRREQKLNCGGIDSCQVANETIQYILNQTLDTWGYPYNLSIASLDLEYTNKQCTSSSDRGTQGFELISIYGGGDVLITLDVCR